MTQSETQIDHDSKIHRCLMYEAFLNLQYEFGTNIFQNIKHTNGWRFEDVTLINYLDALKPLFSKFNDIIDFKFTYFYFVLWISMYFELLANNTVRFRENCWQISGEHLRLHFVADWCIKNRVPFFLQKQYQFKIKQL